MANLRRGHIQYNIDVTEDDIVRNLQTTADEAVEGTIAARQFSNALVKNYATCQTQDNRISQQPVSVQYRQELRMRIASAGHRGIDIRENRRLQKSIFLAGITELPVPMLSQIKAKVMSIISGNTLNSSENCGQSPGR
jgi:hypothetical protein